ncbi:MAG TPA: OB-fold nucleic acid binding domain-containing protein, partial [Thermoleophilaceae bacterium]|nr:OB-fold nucleic acid binding domain-containing protein [Thermoleophilaceae bacterium]
MEQPTLTPARCYARDLAHGQEVDAFFLVRAQARRTKRNGESFLKLQLGDVTGSIEAVVWEQVEECQACSTPGTVVRVAGRYELDGRYGASLTVREMRAAA